MFEFQTKKLLETLIPSLFVIARSIFTFQCVITKLRVCFEANERRGNLLSLINMQEIFNGCKITSQRTRGKEIASGIEQQLAEFMLQRLLTEPRNDEIKYLPH
jgi:flagellin-specific chaperone FliS